MELELSLTLKFGNVTVPLPPSPPRYTYSAESLSNTITYIINMWLNRSITMQGMLWSHVAWLLSIGSWTRFYLTAYYMCNDDFTICHCLQDKLTAATSTQTKLRGLYSA